MRDWLVAEVSRHTDTVSVQRFEVGGSMGVIELTNVIASFRVSERRRVLLGAHWDTRAVAEHDPDPANRETPILGANDGASGVAVLLELARLMSEREPSVGVDLVFFDGEDGGDEGGLGEWCIGSTYYAAHLGDYCPEYAVVIDMIGDCDLSIPIEPNSWAACPLEVDRVWAAAERAEAGSFTRSPGTALYDDHAPLIRAGIPSVLVIDFDYPYWHTLEDTPDKCCPESLAEIGRMLVELIY
jgi:Zn-dependent M28 family amino/carboxypeptidase